MYSPQKIELLTLKTRVLPTSLTAWRLSLAILGFTVLLTEQRTPEARNLINDNNKMWPLCASAWESASLPLPDIFSSCLTSYLNFPDTDIRNASTLPKIDFRVIETLLASLKFLTKIQYQPYH